MLKGFKNQRLFLKTLLSTLFFFTPLVASDPTLVHKTLSIPMRDGVELATDLYYPENTELPLPCILLRTPVERDRYKDRYAHMAHLGYVIAVQSLRSHSHADQYPEPYLQDAWGPLQDGHDTIEYLAESEYTNGKIGTFGASAMGIVQLLTAPSRPPHLKCQFIQVATPSLYHHAAYVGGKLCKHQIESWFSHVAPKAYEKMLEHKEYGPYWEQIDVTKKVAEITVPGLHYGGWYDIFSQGTLDAYFLLQTEGGEGARGYQKLVMGPWTHWGSHPETFGEFAYPEALASFEEAECIQNWFDYHLKDKKDALSKMPNVLYYTMGPLDGSYSSGNCWKEAQEWPPHSGQKAYYFTKAAELSSKMPIFSQKNYSYAYNTESPVPTIGGRNLYLESGPFNQASNEKRSDVLTFTSPALIKDTEITGRIYSKVFVSSTAPSTDVAITLTDVYPDGSSVIIAEGIQTVEINENQVAEVEVDLWSTSQVFAKGHRIRVNIAASNYPHFEKNPLSSDNTLYVGSKYPSHILLPQVLD